MLTDLKELTMDALKKKSGQGCRCLALHVNSLYTNTFFFSLIKYPVKPTHMPCNETLMKQEGVFMSSE